MSLTFLTRQGLIWVAPMLILGATACQSRAQEPPPAPPATSASPEAAPPTRRVVGPLSPADAQALAAALGPHANADGHDITLDLSSAAARVYLRCDAGAQVVIITSVEGLKP